MDTRVRPGAAQAVRQVIGRSLYVLAAAAAVLVTVAALVDVGCAQPVNREGAGPLYAGGPYGPYRRPPIEERIIELPEDGGLWHLVLLLDGSQTSQQLEQQIVGSPRLLSLTRQVKFYRYASNHWWAATHVPYDARPVILLQDDQGRVIYKASGNNLPPHGEELADEIEGAIWRYKSQCGPDCRPSPSRPATRIPDLRDGGGANSQQVSPVALLLVIVAGVAGYLASRRQQT